MIHNYDIYYFINKFDKNEILNLPEKIQLIYRNYEIDSHEETIKKLKDLCKKQNRKIFISNNVKLALKYKLDGLYIPSFNINLNYKNLNINPDFKIIGSAHNIKEILVKEKQGCEAIFISPIFKSLKNQYNLGLTKFCYLSKTTKKNIIALGGINKSNIKKLYCLNLRGIASITWIKKNRPKF